MAIIKSKTAANGCIDVHAHTNGVVTFGITTRGHEPYISASAHLDVKSCREFALALMVCADAAENAPND